MYVHIIHWGTLSFVFGVWQADFLCTKVGMYELLYKLKIE